MPWFRIGIIVYALLYLVGAYFVLHKHSSSGLVAAYLIINGLLILFGTIFEAGRYKPKLQHDKGKWVMTDERFIDDTTGKHMAVRFNPKTGERDYVEDDQAQ